MTVKELREELSHYPEDEQVEIFIENIVDNYGYSINGRAGIEHIGYSIYGSIELSGYDLYS